MSCFKNVIMQAQMPSELTKLSFMVIVYVGYRR